MANDNTIIEAGIPLKAFRYQIETKNTLSHKGSLYVGTGEKETLTIDSETFDCYKTKELEIGNENEVLIVKNGDVTYGKITNSNIDLTQIELIEDVSTSEPLVLVENGISLTISKDENDGHYAFDLACSKVTLAETAYVAADVKESSNPSSLYMRLNALEEKSQMLDNGYMGVASNSTHYIAASNNFTLPTINVGEVKIQAYTHNNERGVADVKLPGNSDQHYWYSFFCTIPGGNYSSDDPEQYFNAVSKNSAEGGTRIGYVSKYSNNNNSSPSCVLVIYGRID